MNITIDCDEVILTTADALRDFYLERIDPAADIPKGTYPSTWPAINLRDVSDMGGLDRFKNLLEQFIYSTSFMCVPPMDYAMSSIRKLYSTGHNLFVLSAIGAKYTERRVEQLERIVGRGIFRKIMCIDPIDSKNDIMREYKIDALIDDGAGNITNAVQAGIHGIFLQCPENKVIHDAVRSGERLDDIPSFVKCDLGLIRERAYIAEDWEQAVSIINSKIR